VVAAVSLGAGSAMVLGLARAVVSAGGAPYGFQGAVFPGFHRHHGNSFGLGTFSSAIALLDFKE